jgi:BirA family biotin operon repressor/biotin-[acetyl-CoA-carboxylase] ligase
VTAPRETWRFDTRHVGRLVHVFDTVPSTNDVAAGLAADSRNAGAVVVADFQTAGRGQYGRVWESRPGSSLLASVLLFPPAELNRPVILTAWAAVAVADAVRQLTGVQARIKWPNDLLVRGKKVCGILIEQRRGTVVGIGLNLNQSADDFAAADLPDAGSLAIAAGAPIDPRAAAGVVVRHLDDEYDRLLAGEWTALEADWKWRVGLLGRHVTAELADGTIVSGRLREMGFDGLELEVGDGALRVLRPEAVRHLRPP